jgi:hypothetical protein
MPIIARILIAFAILLLVGCETRQPLARAQVAGIADNFQRREGLAWGDPTEVLAPGGVDARGRSWWQVRYADGKDGAARVILVDDATAWARAPWAGYALRSGVRPPPGAAHPVAVAEGPLVLVVAPAAPADDARVAESEREVARLNGLAGETGLAPLFGLRRTRDGKLALVYGWQATHGIARDERIAEWLTLRTPYRDATWESFAQE